MQSSPENPRKHFQDLYSEVGWGSLLPLPNVNADPQRKVPCEGPEVIKDELDHTGYSNKS